MKLISVIMQIMSSVCHVIDLFSSFEQQQEKVPSKIRLPVQVLLIVPFTRMTQFYFLNSQWSVSSLMISLILFSCFVLPRVHARLLTDNASTLTTEKIKLNKKEKIIK